jgi:serine/threonine protein kinase
MSPEQLSGDKLDGRSDIYALGLVTFNMLTGKLPFPAETLQESMIMRLTDKPKQLAEMKGDVSWPSELQGVMDRALERAADARYQTAAEFGRDLTRAVKDIRASAATKQVTAMVSPPKSMPSTRMSDQQKPLPPTRVSAATPHQGTPVPAERRRSKAPLIAGAAALVVALAGAGAYFATQGDAASGRTPATPQGDTSGSVSSLPVVNLQQELEDISPLTAADSNSVQMAESALVLLRRIDSAARRADDTTTLLHLRFLRARALISAERVSEGCDSVKPIEGRLSSSTRLKNAVVPLLAVCNSK